jgi:integrase
MKIVTQKDVEKELPPKRYALGGNLYLEVRSATSRQWLFIYQRDGKERSKGLGSATGSKGPKITLAEARKRADRCRAQLADGRDPIAEERIETTLFGAFAETVLKKLAPGFRNPKTERNWRLSLTVHAKLLQSMPVAAITSTDVAATVEPLSLKPASARKLRQRLEIVFRHARTAGLRSGENPASREVLSMPRQKRSDVRHHPAMPYETVPAFMATVRDLDGPKSLLPLQLLILTATRTSETVFSEWSEFDFDRLLWTIPARRVKNGVDHMIPLTPEMLALLTVVKAKRDAAEPRLFSDIGTSAMIRALQRLPGCGGYTVHGFRSSFRDWCGNETAFAREVVEETYGHDVGNEVERAYRRRKGLAKRRQVLEAWNGYVMGSAKVVRLRRAS